MVARWSIASTNIIGTDISIDLLEFSASSESNRRRLQKVSDRICQRSFGFSDPLYYTQEDGSFKASKSSRKTHKLSYALRISVNPEAAQTVAIYVVSILISPSSIAGLTRYLYRRFSITTME